MSLTWQSWNMGLKRRISISLIQPLNLATSNLPQTLHLTPGHLVSLGQLGSDEKYQGHNLTLMCHESPLHAESIRAVAYGQTDSTVYSEVGPAKWQGRREHATTMLLEKEPHYPARCTPGKNRQKRRKPTLRYRNYHIPTSNHTIKQVL